VTCPTPKKIRHGNRATAVHHQRALEQYRKARDLNVYQCGNHWHVGHSVIALSKRIRRALRRDR
jgi:hypothetical protein